MDKGRSIANAGLADPVWFGVRQAIHHSKPSMETQATPPTSEPLSEGAARRAARLATPRLQRETATMVAMLGIYCRGHHGEVARDSEGLCTECAALHAYAIKRLAGCPFGADKPTCANCQIHCYGPRQREQARVVMRYAGPRMLWQHPVLALIHLWVDSRRPAPPKPRGVIASRPTTATGADGAATRE